MVTKGRIRRGRGGAKRGRTMKYILNQVRSTPRRMKVGSNPPPISEQPTGSLTLSFATTATNEQMTSSKTIIDALFVKMGIPNTSEAYSAVSVRLHSAKVWNNGQGGRVYMTHMPGGPSSRTFSDEGTYGRAAGVGLEVPEVLREWRVATDSTSLVSTTTSAIGRLYVNFDYRFASKSTTTLSQNLLLANFQ